MRIVFMGTPLLAAQTLEEVAKEHEVALAVTQPDKPAGRRHQLQAPPVKKWAQEHGIAVAQPEKARDAAFVEQLKEARPESIVVVAYGQILPAEILDLPQQFYAQGTCINLHYSLLPRWRGAAPVQRAIEAGDALTGVSTQHMASKLDAGDLILSRQIEIGQKETAGELFERLVPVGIKVLLESLHLVSEGNAPRVPQQEADATYAKTIKPEERQINWNQTARQISQKIRAFHPRPGTTTTLGQKPLKIRQAAPVKSTFDGEPGELEVSKTRILVGTGNATPYNGEALELIEVQPAGKGPMNAADWARGARLGSGQKLG